MSTGAEAPHLTVPQRRFLRLGGDEASVRSDTLPGSCDEDLGWILGQYKDRLGAIGVAALIQHADGGPATVIASEISDKALAASLRRSNWEPARFQALGSGRKAGTWSWFGPTEASPCTVFAMQVAGDRSCEVVIIAAFPVSSAEADTIEAAGLRLQPVLIGYFKLWVLQRATSRRLHALASAVAGIDFGVVLLDQNAKIVFENLVAARLLDEGKPLRRIRGTLAATKLVESVALRVAVEEAISGKKMRQGSDAAPAVICLRRQAGGAPLVATIAAVGEQGSCPEEAAVVLHIFDPLSATAPRIAPLCEWYDLSPTEARLTEALVAGRSVPAVAAEEGLKQDTVRTYLKRIFRKTGTASQADLVRLMLTNQARVRNIGQRPRGR